MPLLDPQLSLFRCAPADPAVARFVRLLAASGDWLNCGQILDSLQLDTTEANRRLVRAWAAAAESEIISGQSGYRHIDHATTEEIHHFCSWMNHQADLMRLRAHRTAARAHAALHAGRPPLKSQIPACAKRSAAGRSNPKST